MFPQSLKVHIGGDVMSCVLQLDYLLLLQKRKKGDFSIWLI